MRPKTRLKIERVAKMFLRWNLMPNFTCKAGPGQHNSERERQAVFDDFEIKNPSHCPQI